MNRETRPKFVIFDFDGTIANTLEIAFDLGNDLLASISKEPVERSEVARIRGMTLRQILREFNIPLYQLPRLLIRARSIMSAHIAQLQPNPGMIELVQEMHANNYPCGIVSTNSQSNVERFLKTHKIESYFMFVDGGSGAFGKARRLRTTLRRYKLQPDDTLYVGDEIRDIEAARKNNIQVVAVTWGLNSRDRLERSKPDQLVDDVQALRSVIFGVNNG